MTQKDSAVAALRRQMAAVADQDLGKRKEEWLDALGRLFDQIESWARPVANDGLIRIDRRPTAITEERLGPYGVEVVWLFTPASEKIEITPVATFVVGADGRADMKGPRGSRKLIWVRATDGWRFADLTPMGRWTFRDLNEESFWSAVQSLMTEGSDDGSEAKP